MKKVFLSALVVCAMSMLSVAFAQESKAVEGKQQDKKELMQKRQDKMAKELNLTDEQKQQIKASKEEMRNTQATARQKHQADMDKILTPEQKAKMKEMRKQNPEKREMRRRHGMHKMGADSMCPNPQMMDKCRAKAAKCRDMKKGKYVEVKGQCAEKQGQCPQNAEDCKVAKPVEEKK
ncbi:MAG: hypothetical protein IJ442_08615 [Bacteroidaceae bacterium]|nr:hypothetical protein [Bacteroidaceae bacterium]